MNTLVENSNPAALNISGLISTTLESREGFDTLPLRIGAGVTFAAHGAQKLFGWFGGYGLEGTAGWMASIGLEPGYLMALAAGSAEFFGGLALIAGVLVRPAALVLAVTMLVAIFTVHYANGLFMTRTQRKVLFALWRQRTKVLRRLKLVRYFRQTNMRPQWMVLSVLPVLPPDLRPIIQLNGNQVAVSDLNKLYQKVIFRNQRIKRFARGQYTINNSPEMRYATRLLQECPLKIYHFFSR